MNYATLHQVRAYLKLKATETDDDNLLKTFIRQSVKSIDGYCKRRFDIRRETRSFDYPLPKFERIGVYRAEDFVTQMNVLGDWLDARLKVDDDLLEVVTLTNGNGNAFSTSDFVLEPTNLFPKHSVRLLESSDQVWETGTSGDREQIIDLDGYWGFHDRYDDDTWVDSLDTVQDDPLSAVSTQLTVSDADGDAGDTLGYRIQAGNVLKIESEFVFVASVDYTTNVCTITRAYSGTTVAEHVQGTKIYVFRPMANIVLACTRLVAWRYRQKDVDTFDKAAILGSGIAIIPSAMPADVRDLLPSPKPSRL